MKSRISHWDSARYGFISATRARNLLISLGFDVGRFRLYRRIKGDSAIKRIFILSSHPLFSAGVETLLRDETGLELVGRETSPDRAIERIKELKPDIVILDTDYATCNSDPVLIRIFQEQLGIQVIGMNLQDNRICIYHEERRVVQCVDDLKSIIKNDAKVQPV